MDTDPFAGKSAWFASHYASGRGRIRLELVMERIVPVLPAPPARVLDAGGGTGAFSLPLAARGYRVTIMDRSAEWLALASERAAREGLEVALVEGPVEAASDLVDGPFDAVLLHTVLIYVDAPEAALAGLRRVAREGAVLSSLEKNRLALPIRPGLQGDFEEAVRVLDDSVATGRLGIPNRAFAPGELRAMLLRAGWLPTGWAGIRLFSDLLPDDVDDATLAAALGLDRRVAAREPYRRLGRLTHVLAVAAGPPEPLAAVQARSLGRAAPATRDSWPPEQAMGGSSLDAFVRKRRYAVLTTTRPDGRPHAAMVAFVVREGRVWLPAVAGAVRVRNLAHEPRASLVISEGFGGRHRAVLIEGHAAVHAGDAEVDRLLASFLREAWRETHGTDLHWAGAVVELRPDRVLSHRAAGS